MRTRTAALLAGALVVMTSCDLPTNVDEARQRLGEGQEERIVPIQLPMPELSVTLADQMAELSEIVDTTDLSIRVDPDTFALGLDSLLNIDPVDPDPVTQGYDIQISDFTQSINVSLPSVPLTLPGRGFSAPLVPTATPGTIALGTSMQGTFATATFVTGSGLEIALATDAASSLTNVSATLEDEFGTQLAGPTGSVSLGNSDADTLNMDLGGVTLPDTFDIVLSYDAANGDGSTSNLTVDMQFVNAEVESATGVDTAVVSTVSFSESVALDQTGDNFSRATMASGTVAVSSFSSGTLEFTPTFSGNLSGLTIGASPPDSLIVSGDVGPPAASTVDVETSASLDLAFTNLAVDSVVLDSISMDVNQSVAISDPDSTLDKLQEVTVDSGGLQIEIANRLDVSGTLTLTLNGAVDASGNTITQDITISPSTDGSAVTSTATVDLAGAVLTPANLNPQVVGTIIGTNSTVTPAIASDAVTVDPLLDIRPREVVLNGVPNLAVTLNEQVAVPAADIALEELSDLLGKLDFNDVTFTVTFDNGSGLDMQVDGFQMTLLDSVGVPILAGADTARVALSNDTSGLVLAPANAVTTVTGAANTFVNQLLDEVAEGRDVTIAVGGEAGPAADSGSVALGDSLTVVFEIALGPDMTIDPSGIEFDQVVAEAMDLDSVASEFLVDLSEDLESAALEFEVINGLPLGMAVEMVLAPTPQDTTVWEDWDPFVEDSVISLPEFSFAAGQVDTATGTVTAPTVDTASATVQPSEFGVLEKGQLGMGLRATITGPTGDRAVLQPTDSLVLRPLLKIEIRVGGGGSQ